MTPIMFRIKRFFLTLKYNTMEKKKLPLYKLSFLDLQKQYNLIDEYEYEIETSHIINENKPETEIKIADLEIMLKYNKINEIEYYKEKNDILGKPWVAIKTNYDENNNPDNLEIEVVYNKTFIKNMKRKGYSGEEEDIVEQWLKLFFMANLEEEDFSLLTNENQQEYFTRHKLSDDKTIII